MGRRIQIEREMALLCACAFANALSLRRASISLSSAYPHSPFKRAVRTSAGYEGITPAYAYIQKKVHLGVLFCLTGGNFIHSVLNSNIELPRLFWEQSKTPRARMQANKLKKSPPGWALSEASSAGRQRGGESRTMSLARSMGAATNHGTETGRSSRTNNTTAWTPSSSSSSARITSWGATHDEDDSTSEAESTSRGVVAYRSAEHAIARPHSGSLPEYSLSFFQQSIAYSAWAVTHPVSAVEHHWAMRATRAEALLDAHAVHRREMSSLEERRSVSLSL